MKEKQKSQWQKELDKKLAQPCVQKSFCETVKPRFNRACLDKPPIEYKPSFSGQDC